MATRTNRLVEWARLTGDEVPDSVEERPAADFEGGFAEFYDAGRERR